MRRVVLSAALVFALVPVTAHAQRRVQECELNPAGAQGNLKLFNQGTPQQVAYFSGRTEFRCSGGVTIIADSIMQFAATQTRYFIGRVSYTDADKSVTAVRMSSMGAEGRVSAQENVVFTDRKNGSVVRGQNLEYYEGGTAGAGGPDSKALIFGGRPHAVIRQARRGAKPPAPAPGEPAADTTAIIVDADQMEFRGQRYFKGITNVVLVRGALRGTGGEFEFDRSVNRIKLAGSAKVNGESYSLTGGTITGTLNGDRLQDVSGEFKAVLLADELRVEAPAIRIAFDSAGKVQNMVAVNSSRAGREAIEGAVTARAFARDFELTADSIHALTPGQLVDRVTAIGGAYGVRKNDSIQSKLPEVASRDWLRGDTIRAFFAAMKPVADAATGRITVTADTTKRELERVIAIGGGTDAQSTYRIVNSRDPASPPGLNYLAAKQITLQFRGGEVESVEAVGKTRGIHLQPNASPPVAPDSMAPPARPATGAAPARSR